MAYLTGLSGDASLYADHVRPAADYLVAHGPSFGNERWEEQGGYSPSTIAAEIAGLTAASHIAHVQGDQAHARLYQAVADDFQRTVKGFTVTHTGPYSASPYFIRLSKNGDPDSAVTYGLGNGSVNADQRAVVDGGFQELVRLGELPADRRRRAELARRSSTSSSAPPRRPAPATTATAPPPPAARTGTATASPRTRPTARRTASRGRPPNTGSGHLWPVLSGERAESALSTGDTGAGAHPARLHARLRVGCRTGPGAGLGGPRPGRVAVRHATRPPPRSASATATPPARPRR